MYHLGHKTVFIVIRHHIKKRHLSRNCRLALLGLFITQKFRIQNLFMSVSVQTVKRTGLYKTFNTPLVQILLRQSVYEIFKCQILSVQCPLSNQCIRHSLSDSLYSGKSESDSVLIHTEGSLTAVYIRR